MDGDQKLQFIGEATEAQRSREHAKFMLALNNSGALRWDLCPSPGLILLLLDVFPCTPDKYLSCFISVDEF